MFHLRGNSDCCCGLIGRTFLKGKVSFGVDGLVHDFVRMESLEGVRSKLDGKMTQRSGVLVV